MAHMNGEPAKIEILAPFSAAFEWMKAMLFRPFDVVRWLTIAFAAFLAGSLGGGGGNLGRLGRLGDGDFKYRATSQGDLPSYLHPENWVIGCVVVAVVAGLIIGFVWMWISSRGRFIFTDCVVRNRAAIKEPWREFRREGNSFFLFSLLVAAGMICLIGITILVAWVPLQMLSGHRNSGQVMAVPLVLLLVVVVLIWLLLALFFALVAHFMVPVMYRRRCLARDAFLDVTKLIFRNPGPFALFVLFGIALALAVGAIGTAIACMTCCVGGAPYVSTVLLLPAIVWLAAFKLLFLRQFGDPYDVWSNAGPASQPTPLAASPPIAPA
jgi:hypothetical protein